MGFCRVYMDCNTFIFYEITIPSDWKNMIDESQYAFHHPNQANGMQANVNGLRNAHEENDNDLDNDLQPNYPKFFNNFMIDVCFCMCVFCH